MAQMIDMREQVYAHLAVCTIERTSSIEPADKDCKSCGYFPIQRRRIEQCAHALSSRYHCPDCGYDFSYNGAK